MNVLDMFEDPDDATDYFNKTFLSVADAHAPLVQKRVKNRGSLLMDDTPHLQ